MKRLFCLLLVILIIRSVGGITGFKSSEAESKPQFSIVAILQVDNPYIIINDFPYEIDPGGTTKPVMKTYGFFWALREFLQKYIN